MRAGCSVRHVGPLIVGPPAAVVACGLGGWGWGAAAALIAAAWTAWRAARLLRRSAEEHDRHRLADHARMRDLCGRVEQAQQQQGEWLVQARVAESQRRRLEDILNTFTDAVLVTDAFNELLHANESARRLLNIAGDARLRPIDQVLDDRQLVKLIKDTREGGLAHRHAERELARDGQAGVYDVSVSQIADDRGPAADRRGVITVLRDVTRRKEIEKTKNELISNVSHELRTPLASIKAYLEMLADGEVRTDRSLAEVYQIMQSETSRLSRLIENMLNLSRIEAGLMHVVREPVLLTGLVREAFDVLRPQAAMKSIELRSNDAVAGRMVSVDRDMILQVLLNLIGNAVKYTSAGGRVEVVCGEDAGGGVARVSVTDTGPGIPESDLPRLFEKFFRSEANRRFARGTGLGLSLARRVVEDLHGGRIWVKSAVGEGSTFTFILPFADSCAGGWAMADSAREIDQGLSGPGVER